MLHKFIASEVLQLAQGRHLFSGGGAGAETHVVETAPILCPVVRSPSWAAAGGECVHAGACGGCRFSSL